MPGREGIGFGQATTSLPLTAKIGFSESKRTALLASYGNGLKMFAPHVRNARTHRVLGRRPVELRETLYRLARCFQSRPCSELKLYVPFQS